MEIYCLPEFKKEYERLCKKDSYSDLTHEMIECFFNKKFSDCLTGKNLNQSTIAPYYKRDIGGRGGYRLYYVALIKSEKIYFGFVHPKTGSMGSSNTTDDFRGQLIKDILRSITSNDLLKVSFTDKSIKFDKF